MALRYLLRDDYANEQLRRFRKERPPGAFFYVVCVRLFPAYSYPWVYEAQPMLSLAVVPVSNFEILRRLRKSIHKRAGT